MKNKNVPPSVRALFVIILLSVCCYTHTFACSGTVTPGSARSICTGQSTQLGANSVAGYTYAWTSSPSGYTSTSANPTVSPTITTTYTLVQTKTSNGCAETGTVVVTVNPLPTPSAGSASTICAGSSASIGESSTAGHTYSWSSSPSGYSSTTSNPSVSPTTTTTYTLTEKITSTGCTNTATVIITVNPAPAANAGSNTSICKGSSTSIGAASTAGHTYSWVSSPSGFTSTVSNPSVSPTTTTTYTLTEKITATGCTNSNSITITVNTPPSANAGSNSTICASDNVVSLNGSVTGATGGVWSGGSGLFISGDSVLISAAVTYGVSGGYVPSPTEVSAGTVTLTLTTTGNGACTAATSNVTITIKAAPAPVVTGATIACENTNYTYTTPSHAGDTYSWTTLGGAIQSGGSTNSVVVNWGNTAGVGDLYVTETNSSGCASSSYLKEFSRFDFNSNPIEDATIGPNGETNNTNAYSDGVGYTMKNTCGTDSSGFDLNIPGKTYNKGKMAMAFRLSREESEADIFMRGNTRFAFSGGNLSVEYVVSNGSGGSTTIGPINTGYAPPEDDSLRNYLFEYDSATGTANLYVGTTKEWTNTTTAARGMVWTGDSTVVIGDSMDGSCDNYTIMDFASFGTPVSIVAPPAANAGSPSSICSGTSASIGAAAVAGDTYAWTSNPSGFTSTAANPSVSPTVTTTYTLTETITATGCTNSNSVTITVNPLPSNNAGSNASICTGSSTTVGAASTAGHTYSWVSSPAGFTSTTANPSVSPTITTTYTLTEKITATGCNTSNSVTITVNPLPSNNAGISASICTGSSTTVGAASTAGHTYSWVSSPSGFTSTAANPSVSPTVTTTYTLTEKINATGCTNSNSVTITVNSLPAANAGSNSSICAGSSTTVGAASTAGHTYSWVSSPSGFMSTASNPSVSPTVTTTYTLTEKITATGCTNSNSAIITVNPLPTTNAGSNTSICTGSGTTIGAASTAGHTYSWVSSPSGFTSTASNPSVSPTITTTYTLTETITATGCNYSNSVTITVNPLPSANAGSNASVCTGSGTTIGAASTAGHTYSWVSSPSGFTSTLSNPYVSPATTTTYTLTETITATGCTNTHSITITVSGLPAANAGSNQTICLLSTATIGAAAVAGHTYSWTSTPSGFTSTSANPIVSPTVTSTYTLTETITATGCIMSNSVVISINPLPAAATGSNKTICSGTADTLGAAAAAGHTYSWSSSPAGFTSSMANPPISPTVTKTYTVTETNTSTGCSFSNSVIITVNPLPAADAGINQDVCSGYSAFIGAAAVGGDTYSWVSSPSGFTSTASGNSVSPDTTTVYTVTETNTSTGCSKSNSVTITVHAKPLTDLIKH